MKRALGPRPPVEATPITVTDRTCVAVIGIEWRALKRFCCDHQIAIRRIGRRPVVRVDAVLAALEGNTSTGWSEDEIVARAASGVRR